MQMILLRKPFGKGWVRLPIRGFGDHLVTRAREARPDSAPFFTKKMARLKLKKLPNPSRMVLDQILAEARPPGMSKARSGRNNNGSLEKL